MFRELLFLGNPIIDITCKYDRRVIDDVFGTVPEPGHYPIETLLSLEARAPQLHFAGASGGAFTAAAVAAGSCAGVSYYGSCGRDFGLFKSIAEKQGFALFDPAGNRTEAAGRCLLFLGEQGTLGTHGEAVAGPFVNRGAAALFGSEMMPPISRTSLPFIEGYLMANWQQLPEFAAESCAIDLSSVFVIPQIRPMIDQLKQLKNMIIFANQEEAEMLLGADLGQARSPSHAFHQNAVRFCQGRHVLVVKAAHNGAVVFSSGSSAENPTWVAASKVPGGKVLDSSNAGDCFAGAFLASLMQGGDMKTAAAHGADAGAICVSRYGNGFA
ncbi:MAG: PfkB family carbohydrate kinase [Spirochaeta sp.]|nr:PfkB family carbohydrate kinase [Spirochaeta sp.]